MLTFFANTPLLEPLSNLAGVRCNPFISAFSRLRLPGRISLILNRQIFLASRSTPVSFLNVTFVLCLALCLSSCVVSPAPNYRIDKAAVRIEFTPGQSPELRLSASYTLENYGTSVLPFIDVMLPNETRYRIRSPMVKVNGQTVNSAQGLEGSPERGRARIRVPLDPGWHPRERRDLVIEYNFNAQDGAEKSEALAAASFYLISPDWLPVLQPPSHVLSSTPAIPQGTIYSVQVPADFLVLASGKPRGRKKDGGAVKYQFESRKDDSAPYVIAGRYVETSSSRQKNSVSFWTFGPLKGDPAGVEKQIASVSDILQKNFGPLDKNSPGVRIVEFGRSLFGCYIRTSSRSFSGGCFGQFTSDGGRNRKSKIFEIYLKCFGA